MKALKLDEDDPKIIIRLKREAANGWCSSATARLRYDHRHHHSLRRQTLERQRLLPLRAFWPPQLQAQELQSLSLLHLWIRCSPQNPSCATQTQDSGRVGEFGIAARSAGEHLQQPVPSFCGHKGVCGGRFAPYRCRQCEDIG